MKKIGFLVLIMAGSMMYAQNLKEYRTLIKKGEKSEQAAKTLIDRSSAAYEETNRAVFAGFMAVGKFFLAKHSYNPIRKVSFFNDGKHLLERAVKADPQNIEIRLIRLMAQENAPRIMGYNQNIREDREFLKNEYTRASDDELRTYIKKYLKL